MRFQVPQFIETETKLVGPFTFRQFIYIAGGAALIYILRFVVSITLIWILVSLPLGALALALAFFKIDGIPLPNYLMRAVSFLAGSKKYIYSQAKTQNNALEKILSAYGQRK